jgi:ribosomal protein L11 methyltransferase
MPTFSLTLEVDRAEADDRASALFELGATGVEVRDGEAAPMPGTAAPPAGRAVLVAFFAARDEALAAAAEQGGELGAIADQDWGEAWKRGLGPLTVGRVHVRPSWIEAPAPAGSAEVVLDPGMAFGTGTHATTALCLGALSELVTARPGLSVLDVGTGSGLLAIAARKLGAGLTVGVDNDPVAVRVARENAERNAVDVALSETPAGEVRGTFDLVLANILANTLVELAPALEARLAPGGVVLLSGILAPQAEEVRRAYVALGLRPLAGADRTEGEWVLLALEKPAA